MLRLVQTNSPPLDDSPRLGLGQNHLDEVIIAKIFKYFFYDELPQDPPHMLSQQSN